MEIKYFRDEELVYTNRRRYKTFNFTPFSVEIQKSVLLGDGAKTSIKTKKSNLCNYVIIDNTRWFVISHIYLNGGQIVLNLQRDVIGEFGINNCFGKIERGFTNSILKNRKELSLNQILRKRIPLKPLTNLYGNYSVSNHKDEMWGILYMVKQDKDQVVIPIPSLRPKTVNLNPVVNGSSYYTYAKRRRFLEFYVNLGNLQDQSEQFTYQYKIQLNFYFNGNNPYYEITVIDMGTGHNIMGFNIKTNSVGSGSQEVKSVNQIARKIGKLIGDYVLSGYGESSYNLMELVVDPDDLITDFPVDNYRNTYVETDNKLYKYTVSDNKYFLFDKYLRAVPIVNAISSYLLNKKLDGDNNNYVYISSCTTNGNIGTPLEGTYVTADVHMDYIISTINFVEVAGDEAGELTIDFSTQDLIDEPYYILAVPLYDVDITGIENYSVTRLSAFNVFNEVIRTLSGENGYIVDAQIYPYCPILTSVSTSVRTIPFFTIKSTSFETLCIADLLPSVDVKKDYIEKSYAIVSPEQSSKFIFNFYDYITRIEPLQSDVTKNSVKMNIKIKTALKPFTIISSAVIERDEDSLIGIKYASDLNGSQPSGNGFECSLASNAFETYQRQNSNYQQIFAKEQETLSKQQEVEKTNDIVQAVANTASATAMGAIAGASIADSGIGSLFGSKSVGATAGGVSAGSLVGGMMTWQTEVNEGLRQYEKRLQTEMFNLNIGTIKNLPNSITRVSSFNEIILKDFYYVIEVYECSDFEKVVVDNFIREYGYSIGVYDYIINYYKEGWFLKGELIKSTYAVNLHTIAQNELAGGIYLYD